MADHPRCEGCPIVGRCVVEWTGHTPYCDWAKRGGDRLERVRELSEAGPPGDAGIPVATVPGGESAPAGEESEYPSIFRQAMNLTGAVARGSGAILGGQILMVEQAEFERRQAICRGCSEYDADQRRCRLCGCWTDLKLRLATERCPIDPPKW